MCLVSGSSFPYLCFFVPSARYVDIDNELEEKKRSLDEREKEVRRTACAGIIGSCLSLYPVENVCLPCIDDCWGMRVWIRNDRTSKTAILQTTEREGRLSELEASLTALQKQLKVRFPNWILI